MPSKKFWFNVCLSFLQSQMTTTGNCLQRNLNSIWMSLMQVYDALKDGAYHQFKAYVAKKAVIATGDVYKIKLIHEHRFDHDYAMNNLLDDIIDAWHRIHILSNNKEANVEYDSKEILNRGYHQLQSLSKIIFKYYSFIYFTSSRSFTQRSFNKSWRNCCLYTRFWIIWKLNEDETMSCSVPLQTPSLLNSSSSVSLSFFTL